MLGFRLLVWFAIGVAAACYAGYYVQGPTVEVNRDLCLRQFEDNDEVPQMIRRDLWTRNEIYTAGTIGWIFLGLVMFMPEIAEGIRQMHGLQSGQRS